MQNGGGNNSVSSNKREEVIDIATDSQRNVYIVSKISKDGTMLNSSLPISVYELNSNDVDVILVSYSCEGNYRWHKVFGGGDNDNIVGVEVDTQDNIFVVGSLAQCRNDDGSYPSYSIPRIGDNNGVDFISSNTQDFCNRSFIAKFTSNGVYQWVHFFHDPVPYDQPTLFMIRNTYMVNDNLFCIARIAPGSYEGGAFSNTNNSLPFLHYLLKYDTSGNFISATPFELELSNYTSAELRWCRNPYNGYYYAIFLYNSNTITVSAGGNNLDYTLPKIICFNNLGQYQWYREVTGSATLNTLTFDDQNNIYVGGFPGNQILPGSFNNYSYTSGYDGNYFIMKCNSDITSYDWVTRYSTPGNIGGYGQLASSSLHYDRINSEIIFGGQIILNTTWGTQNILGPGVNNTGDPLLARFDSSNGNCLSMHRIVGTNGFQDSFTAIEQDVAGDLIVGGFMGLDLTDSNGNTHYTSGGNTDFFVTKFATQACQSLSNENFDYLKIDVFPNPARDILNLNNVPETMQYIIYNLMGAKMLEGNISSELSSIDVSKLSVGCYLLSLKNEKGLIETFKIVKE
ncbi:T9SS type A sorting domain-containing protein [Flavobacterium haoranii]|uniref:T9SS type A sorting domain-containing protein n=1 Tax=Flavobacterium haoranii TaxID=683124 RepID=UPI000932BF02|nr:T9SS type A sorting domain-containing protein [Flavobacterium haoranii]